VRREASLRAVVQTCARNTGCPPCASVTMNSAVPPCLIVSISTSSLPELRHSHELPGQRDWPVARGNLLTQGSQRDAVMYPPGRTPNIPTSINVDRVPLSAADSVVACINPAIIAPADRRVQNAQERAISRQGGPASADLALLGFASPSRETTSRP